MKHILIFSLVLSIFTSTELLAMNPIQQRPWVPIDIVGTNVIDIDNPNGHWRTGDPNRGWIDNRFNVWGNIHSKYEYRVPHLQNGRMVFIVIHGSLPAPETGPFNPSYYKPDDKKDQNFRHIMRFASHLARLEGKELDLLSFQWSGLIDETARKVASMLLTRYVETHYAQGTDIVILSHSHGCNIANLVSYRLSWPIKLLLHFANPVRTDEMQMPKGLGASLAWAVKHPMSAAYGISGKYNDATPDKFETLIYFYSTSDIIATLGALKKGDTGAFLLNAAAIHYAGELIMDQIPGVGAVRHLKKVVTFGRGTVQSINSATYVQLMYKDIKNAYIQAGQEGKIVVGVRAQINGEDPGHGNIIDIVQDLSHVYASITNNYMLHFLNSSLFDLHVNMQQPNDIHVAVRRVTNAGNIPVNPLATQLLGQHNIQQILQIGQQETQFSAQQAQNYRARYNRDLNNVPRDQHKYISAVEDNCTIM